VPPATRAVDVSQEHAIGLCRFDISHELGYGKQCIAVRGDMIYPEVGIATVELLERFGLDVGYPLNQTCCGQPMSDSGDEVNMPSALKRRAMAAPVVAPRTKANHIGHRRLTFASCAVAGRGAA
jgi:Cysteine-rich domain